jgi:O-antigen/teichoic acid export membrane protein
VSASAFLIMLLLREPIYQFFAGERSALGARVFVLWLVASLFTIASVSLNPVMVVLRLDASMAKVYRWTGLTFLVAAPIACAWFGILGMAGATLFTEGFMAFFCATSVMIALRDAGGRQPANSQTVGSEPQ